MGVDADAGWGGWRAGRRGHCSVGGRGPHGRGVPDPSAAAPATDRLPDGFGVRMSASVETRDDDRTLIGGDRGGVLYLTSRAADVLDAEGTLRVGDAASATLGRLLLDRGFGVPWWPGPPPPGDRVDDVTVVIPVRDRPTQLRRLLAHLPAGVPVIVGDDGSADPTTNAAVGRAANKMIEEVRRTWQFYRDRRPDSYGDMVKLLP